LDRATAGLPAPKEVDSGFRKSFKTGPAMTELTRQLLKANYKFLRIHDVDDTRRALFRLIKPGNAGKTDAGVVYHDLILERKNGATQIADVYVVGSGELLSETARKLFLVALARIKKGFFARLLGDEVEEIKYINDMMEFSRLLKDKKLPDAMKIHQNFPPDLQTNKTILFQRLSAALQTEDKDYEPALDLWQKTFPKDPSFDFVAMDFYLLKKKPLKLIEAIEQLDEKVGGDAYLDLLKATQWQMLEDWGKSAEAARRALVREPSMTQAYTLLLGSYLESGNHAEIKQILINLHVNSNEDATKYIARHPKYPQFTQSPAFKDWLQYKNPPPVVVPRPVPTAVTREPNKSGANAGKSKPSDLRLQGIMLGGKNVCALINGKTLFLGEQIGLYTVRKIENNKVTLESASGQEKVLTLKELYTE